MPVKINLLPSDQRVGKDVLKILKVVRMLGVVSLGLFIVFGIGIGAFFMVSSIQSTNLNSANSTLKTQISGLEASENKIVLLKDRVGKIKTIQKIPSAIKNLDAVNSLVSNLSTDTNVSELNIATSKITTSVNFRSNSDLANFIKSLGSSDSFKAINISSFNFNPSTGYLVGISMTGK